jgi:hypothetical protein
VEALLVVAAVADELPPLPLLLLLLPQPVSAANDTAMPTAAMPVAVRRDRGRR